MILFRNNVLLNNNGVAIGAMLAFREAFLCAGCGNGFVNNNIRVIVRVNRDFPLRNNDCVAGYAKTASSVTDFGASCRSSFNFNNIGVVIRVNRSNRCLTITVPQTEQCLPSVRPV